jgi:hypothetical protein
MIKFNIFLLDCNLIPSTWNCYTTPSLGMPGLILNCIDANKIVALALSIEKSDAGLLSHKEKGLQITTLFKS